MLGSEAQSFIRSLLRLVLAAGLATSYYYRPAVNYFLVWCCPLRLAAGWVGVIVMAVVVVASQTDASQSHTPRPSPGVLEVPIHDETSARTIYVYCS